MEPVEQPDDIAELRAVIEKHAAMTDSPVAAKLLARWETLLPRFVKVMPVEYRRALERIAREGEST